LADRTQRPLLLVGGASPAPGRDCLDQAGRRGMPVCLADTAAHLAASPDLTARAADVIELPFHDVEACAAWAREAGQAREFIGVYGFRELAMESVAAIAEVLGLPGTGLATARLLRDKSQCRQALREHGFRQPPSALCAAADEAIAFVSATPPGPWIIKPATAQGSVGISLIHDAAQVDGALEHLVASYRDFARDASLPGSVVASARAGFLVEGFQRGAEYSVEGVCVDGVPRVLAITEKLTTGAPHFVETGHTMPAELGAATETRVTETVRRALRALGLQWGVFHVECWIDGAEVILGELHNRPGGDHIHTMVQHVTGIELHGVVFDQMLGRQSATSRWRPSRGAAIRFLTPPPGRVTAVRGWDRVRADPRVITGHLGLAPGDLVGPLTSYLDRSSYVVVSGPTRQAAADTARDLCAAIAVDTRDVA
jgi:biotin carboxylase